jgi:hypothetical protein
MHIFDDVRQVSVSKVVCSYHGVYSFVYLMTKKDAKPRLISWVLLLQ